MQAPPPLKTHTWGAHLLLVLHLSDSPFCHPVDILGRGSVGIAEGLVWGLQVPLLEISPVRGANKRPISPGSTGSQVSSTYCIDSSMGRSKRRNGSPTKGVAPVAEHVLPVLLVRVVRKGVQAQLRGQQADPVSSPAAVQAHVPPLERKGAGQQEL